MYNSRLTIAALTAGLLISAQASAGQSTLYAAGPNMISQGAQALQRGDLKQAIRLTRRGIRQTVDDKYKAIGFNNLCIAYRQTNDPVRAIRACNSAVNLQPAYWRALNNRANVFFQAGDYEAAKRDYRKALEMKPGSRNLRQNLNRVNQMTGK